MKALPLESCKECLNRLTSPYPTSDIFERPEYWWCKHCSLINVPDKNEEDEKRRLSLMENSPFVLRKIAGYVKWNDRLGIPSWCPLDNI